ncbi:hypothetical protein D9V29_03580 [Mycetocola manganoxydans]|uniref:Uncharacterized protein n=1 Tax=Mycetocola manganoxydans TaxID=699879 RepID=A0A3L6ZYI0_9MICO|nr:hypothetical protein [Mycetocola manganoxydans]RLP73096.1 hypothetical protein D9V29_03580 [Mycetocola manganoxydans]
MDQQHPTENGNETLPPLPDQGQRDGSYEEAKNEGTAEQSSLEDAPDDGTTATSGQSSSDASVDGSDDEGRTAASGQAGTYSDTGTDAVDTTVPVQD